MDKRFMGLDMARLFRQKILIGELAESVRKEGYENLANELEAALAVFDAVQDEAENVGYFTFPEYDDSTGKVVYDCDYYNNVLEDILKDEKNQKKTSGGKNGEPLAKATESGEALHEGGHYYTAKKPIIAFDAGKVLTKFNLDVLQHILEVDTDRLIDNGDIEAVEAPSVEYFLEHGDGYAAAVRYQEVHACDFNTASAEILRMARKNKNKS